MPFFFFFLAKTFRIDVSDKVASEMLESVVISKPFDVIC